MNQKEQLANTKSALTNTIINSRSMSATVTVNFFLAPIKASKKLCRCLSSSSINDKNYSTNSDINNKKAKKLKNNDSSLHYLAKTKKVVTKEDIIELHKSMTE